MVVEESIWASMNSWFTPAILFVLLNVVIGIIAITSHKHKDQQQQQQQQQIYRAPSLLHRLRSIELYRYRSEAPMAVSSAAPPPDPPPQHQPDHHPERPDLHRDSESEEDGDGGHRVTRSVSDTGGEAPVRLARRMRKSASVKSAFAHFEEDREAEERRRPATARVAAAADEEVDAKADDFINRFKQQLKLQRLESLMRYKDLITRGATA